MVDLRQSPAFAKYLTSIGWIVEKGIFIRPLWIFGAVAKIQRGTLPNDWKAILKKHHVWMLEINYAATKTLRVDLNDIRPKKDCRRILRKFQDGNYKIQDNNFDEFYSIWQKSAWRKNLWIPKFKEYTNLINAFGENCFCITIDNQAGALILMHDKTAYYFYAGATKEGTKLNLPYLVVWQCMQEAKKRGCKIWDFEGIYDDRFPNKDWLGFSHFKKSFGGQEVEFPGSIIKYGFY